MNFQLKYKFYKIQKMSDEKQRSSNYYFPPSQLVKKKIMFYVFPFIYILMSGHLACLID